MLYILKGLPYVDNSCDAVYCSHTLEHLSLTDFRIALNNTFKMLKSGGRFRCVVPDLEYYAKVYLDELSCANNKANSNFMSGTYLGQRTSNKGIIPKLRQLYGNASHLWMWDTISLTFALKAVGFTKVRECSFNDSEDKMFNLVENRDRFVNAVSLEAIK